MIITTSSRLYARPAFASASLIEVGHPRRQEVEHFIAAVYLRRYGAQLRRFLPQFLVYRDADGELMAAVGMRLGSAGGLFVEQYLDEPAESALAACMAVPVARSGLAEVGNFAAISSGSARALIPQMTHALHNVGVRWVLFGATRGLRNTFNRLQLGTVGWCLPCSRVFATMTPIGAVTTPRNRKWYAATSPPGMPFCWSGRRCARRPHARASTRCRT